MRLSKRAVAQIVAQCRLHSEKIPDQVIYLSQRRLTHGLFTYNLYGDQPATDGSWRKLYLVMPENDAPMTEFSEFGERSFSVTVKVGNYGAINGVDCCLFSFEAKE